MENDFEKELDKKLGELSACQQNMGVESCMGCDEIIGCEIRAKYVDAVYQSMNGGSSGTFDFDG